MAALSHDMDAELGRMRALEATGLLAHPAPPEADEACRRACARFGVPIALVTLVAADRLVVKAAWGAPLGQAPRLHQFCDQAVRRDEVLVVPDARAHPVFAAHPLVAGPPGLRFYAGAPLPYVRGIRLGALCLLDTRPRDLSPEDRAELERMADEVMAAVLEQRYERLAATVH
jgi:GAF domain-containing protein